MQPARAVAISNPFSRAFFFPKRLNQFPLGVLNLQVLLLTAGGLENKFVSGP